MTRIFPAAALWTSKWSTDEEYVKIACVRIDRKSVHHDYDVTDDKGRKVGGFLVECVERVDVRTDDKSGTIMKRAEFEATNDDGMRYGYEVSSARDGKSFGACVHTKWFNTEAERDTAAAKALANARKRVQKKFA